MAKQRTWILECLTDYGWVALSGTNTSNKRYAFRKRRDFAVHYKAKLKEFRVAEYTLISTHSDESGRKEEI